MLINNATFARAHNYTVNFGCVEKLRLRISVYLRVSAYGPYTYMCCASTWSDRRARDWTSFLVHAVHYVMFWVEHYVMFWAVFKMDSQTGVNNHGSQFSDDGDIFVNYPQDDYHHVYCDRELLDQTRRGSFVDTGTSHFSRLGLSPSSSASDKVIHIDVSYFYKHFGTLNYVF